MEKPASNQSLSLDNPALSGLFGLSVVVVADNDPRVVALAPGNAACDGSQVFIPSSDLHRLALLDHGNQLRQTRPR
jgi:hypothetical protein